jgi:hypothetical protein
LENNDKNVEIIAKLLRPQIWKEVDFFLLDANLERIDQRIGEFHQTLESTKLKKSNRKLKT